MADYGNCEDCAFFDRLHGDIGQCKIKPPVVIPFNWKDHDDGTTFSSNIVQMHTVWPAVALDEWCAEWVEKTIPA